MKKILFLITLVIAGCATQQLQKTELPANSTTILFSANRNLEFEPCGCSMSPQGGLVREWNYLQAVKKSNPSAFYLVSGTSFYPELGQYESKEKKSYFLKAGYIAEAFKKMGVDVVGLSDEDLRLGLSSLKKLASQYHLDFISTNIIDKKTKAPLFSPYKKVSRNGATFYILSLTSDEGVLPAKSGVMIQSPEIALQEWLGKIPQDGYVVVLSTLSKIDRDPLVQKFTGVHLFLGGQRREDIPGRFTQNTVSTLFANQSGGGKSIYQITLSSPAPKKRFYNANIVREYAELRTYWEENLETYQREIASKQNEKKRASLQASIEQLRTNLKLSKDIIVNPDEQSVLYDYKLVELGPSFDNEDATQNPMYDLIERKKESVRQSMLR